VPINEKTQEQREIERLEELEDREYYEKQGREQRQHELNLAKLRYAAPKHKVIARVLIAFAKVPATIICAVMIPLLALARKEVPAALRDFLIL